MRRRAFNGLDRNESSETNPRDVDRSIQRRPTSLTEREAQDISTTDKHGRTPIRTSTIWANPCSSVVLIFSTYLIVKITISGVTRKRTGRILVPMPVVTNM